jgi:hypothetical protein
MYTATAMRMNNNFIVFRQGLEALTIVPTPGAEMPRNSGPAIKSAIKLLKWEMSLDGRHCSSEYSWGYHCLITIPAKLC